MQRNTKIRIKQAPKFEGLSEAAVFAERLLDANALRFEFESGAIRRKIFCEALDIGESTLSTWLQTGRIPRMAALAYVMWSIAQDRGAELQRRDEMATEPYVIRCQDAFPYAVVQPAPGGDTTNRVIAKVETAELAQKFVVLRSTEFRKVHDHAIDILWEYAEQFEDEGEENRVANAATELERARDFKIGPVTLEELA
jgi:hypothetical protein